MAGTRTAGVEDSVAAGTGSVDALEVLTADEDECDTSAGLGGFDLENKDASPRFSFVSLGT